MDGTDLEHCLHTFDEAFCILKRFRRAILDAIQDSIAEVLSLALKFFNDETVSSKTLSGELRVLTVNNRSHLGIGE